MAGRISSVLRPVSDCKRPSLSLADSPNSLRLPRSRSDYKRPSLSLSDSRNSQRLRRSRSDFKRPSLSLADTPMQLSTLSPLSLLLQPSFLRLFSFHRSHLSVAHPTPL